MLLRVDDPSEAGAVLEILLDLLDGFAAGIVGGKDFGDDVGSAFEVSRSSVRSSEA